MHCPRLFDVPFTADMTAKATAVVEAMDDAKLGVARRWIVALLKDRNIGERGWFDKEALNFRPSKGLRNLDWLSGMPGLIEGSSGCELGGMSVGEQQCRDDLGTRPRWSETIGIETNRIFHEADGLTFDVRGLPQAGPLDGGARHHRSNPEKYDLNPSTCSMRGSEPSSAIVTTRQTASSPVVGTL